MLIRLSVMLPALSARLSFVVFLKREKSKAAKKKKKKNYFVWLLGENAANMRLEQSLAPNISPVYKRHNWFSLHEKFRLSSLNNKK